MINCHQFWAFELTRCSLEGPFWNILDSFELFQTILDCFGLFWTILDPFGPFWNILDHFGPFWAILDHFRPFLTILNHFELFWTILDQFGLVWTNLNQYNQFELIWILAIWTLSHVSTSIGTSLGVSFTHQLVGEGLKLGYPLAQCPTGGLKWKKILADFWEFPTFSWHVYTSFIPKKLRNDGYFCQN